MKKTIYTLLTCTLLIPYLHAQDENAETLKNNTTQVEESKVIEPLKTSENNNDVKATQESLTEESKDLQPEPSSEPMFGSKAHRKNIKYTVTKKTDSSGILLKTCLSLAAVLGLILVVFKGLKKFNSKYINSGTENPMRVCNRTVLDTKNYLTLVRVYEEELLLAVSPTGTTLIARYALIDKEDGEFEEMVNGEGRKVISIDEETHVSSINLQSLQDMKK